MMHDKEDETEIFLSKHLFLLKFSYLHRFVILFGVICSIMACNQTQTLMNPPRNPPVSKATEPVRRFSVDWDTATGRGSMTQTLENGDRYVLCLQCRYPGYTGGLWIGSMNGSGFEYFPAQPIRGFKNLNIFCAQDESLVLADSGEELTNGWSENIGKGPGGKRLEYVNGEILDSTAERVVLKSINRGECIEETRYLLWPAEASYVVVAAHFTNVCKKSVHFDFWTGDDPWIGRYKTSEGDVGWTPDGFVRSETKLETWGADSYRYGGFGKSIVAGKLGPVFRRSQCARFTARAGTATQSVYCQSFRP